uniref:Uncharacterized protein n=1 Tax=Psilocybe cubensis TaxID=181762 RepID=A0A8H7XPS5_PSICU
MCNKRLDSMTLLEHDQQPYCKTCHLKSFGTRDLRHANLPYAQPPADDAAGSGTPSSPTSPNFRNNFTPLRPLNTGVGGAPRATSPLPRLRPNRSLATSPISSSFPRGPNASVQQAFQASATANSPTAGSTNAATSLNLHSNSTSDPKTTDQDTNDNDSAPPTTDDTEEAEVHHSLVGPDSVPVNAETAETEEVDDVDSLPGVTAAATPYPSNTGRPGIGTIPRTVPLYLNGYNSSIGAGAQRTPVKQHHPSQSLSSIPSSSSPTATSPSASSPSNLSKEAEDLPSRYNAGSMSPRGFSNMMPLAPTATGTRYGIALGGGPGPGPGGVGVQMTGTTTGTPRKWGAGTPQCARCAKSVYFAEQVCLSI